jgi:hypothetical protein
MKECVARSLLLLLVLLTAICTVVGQQASPSQFLVSTTSLPSAKLRQPYQFQLQAQSGVPNFRWSVTRGSLPPGLALSESGLISGAATEKGEFPLVVSVTDSSTPAQTKTQAYVFRVVAPLLAEWASPPKVNGRRIEGAIKVTNQTGHDFDLTVIAMAINEAGRATALGYQHRVVKEQEEIQIPIGEQLPRGAYSVDATVVAEIEQTGAIYRVRLAPGNNLQVAIGP